MDQHPSVLARRFDEQSASRDIRSEMGTLLPRVSLNASVGYNEDGLFGSRDQDRTVGSVGVRAVIPIYESGGANYSRVRAAQAQASRARADITQEARDRRAEVEAAWTGLRVARASIRAGREQVEAARLAFEGVREEAIVGSRTTLDVLDAEQELSERPLAACIVGAGRIRRRLHADGRHRGLDRRAAWSERRGLRSRSQLC
jgi:outer membrane protein